MFGMTISMFSKFGTLLLAGYIAWIGWEQLGPRKPEVGALRMEAAGEAVAAVTEDLRINRGDVGSVVLVHFAGDPADYFTNHHYEYATSVTSAVVGYVADHAILVGNPLFDANVDGNLLTLDYLDNFSGNADITVRATDLAGEYAEDTFHLTINPSNDAPEVATPIADLVFDSGDPDPVIRLWNTFADPDFALEHYLAMSAAAREAIVGRGIDPRGFTSIESGVCPSSTPWAGE